MNKDCGCGFIVNPVEFTLLEALLFKVLIRIALFPVPLGTPRGQAVREGRGTDFPVRRPAPGPSHFSCLVLHFAVLEQPTWDVSFVSGLCRAVCKCEVISRSQILYFTCVSFRLSLEVFLLCLPQCLGPLIYISINLMASDFYLLSSSLVLSLCAAAFHGRLAAIHVFITEKQ